MLLVVLCDEVMFGKIDMSRLISESDGAASLSRFQFLIFTFVISLSLMLVILGQEGGPGFPAGITRCWHQRRVLRCLKRHPERSGYQDA